jgi:2-hydroxy-6-oxo-6-(2'-aminophenyl)hexa-2,4-dienoate hydrolase
MPNDSLPTAEAWTSHYIDAGGVQTHYLEAGDRAAPPVVLIHGGGAGAESAGNWSLTIPALADDWRVIAVDMLGFGHTAKPESFEYSQPARNRHLADFLRALGLGPVPLVGNSMGGASALGVAMAHPELVDRLVLMGSAGLNAAITPSLEPIVFYDYTLDGMRRLIAALTNPRFRASEDLIRARHARSIDPGTRRAYTATMEWIRRQGGLFYAEDEIRRVKTPALVVNGKDDQVVPLANAYRFLELLENSWGHLIPHCGHWAMLEAPQEFTAVTRHFLAARWPA